MRIHLLLVSLLAFTGTSPVLAACAVCDQVVTLNAKLAECYVGKYDEVITNLGDGTKPFTKVDLSTCGTPEDLEKGFAGLPTVGGTPRRLKLIYILDKQGADCVLADLKARKDPIDPLAEIDLTDCP